MLLNFIYKLTNNQIIQIYFFLGGGGGGGGEGEHNVQMFQTALLLLKEYKCVRLEYSEIRA